jgi:hypothetical protein
MTFVVETKIFDKLKQRLADSHQALMEPDMPQGDGQSGTITHGGIKATYAYSPNLLTVNVVQGGNLIVNHKIHAEVQTAITALSMP